MRDRTLEYFEVDQDRWVDLELLFDGRGGPKNCWCMVWRKKPAGTNKTSGAARKAVLKGALASRVSDGIPIGILGYCDGAPVAWCSIAPRSSYRPLGGPDEPAEPIVAIWSLVCFFIKSEFRGRGLSAEILDAAVSFARGRGARIVEAYPVDPDSPSYRFMGLVSSFENAGFEKIGSAGIRRHVMRLELD